MSLDLRFPPLAALLLGAIACGADDPADDPAAFPSRDWSGPYALAVTRSSTDCAEAEAPPPLGDLILDVRQSVENDVAVQIGPLVALGGRFDGDALVAEGVISQPIPLPDSISARATVADSLESITYALEASFEEDGGFAGRYVVRAPDLVALTRGSGRRCQYDYEVRGVPLIRGQRRPAEAGGPR